MLPLSAVIITKNEEDRIARCLRSLAPLCQEIIVLDSGSTDATVAIARAEGAIVMHQDWLGFGAQKNAAAARASQHWIILLDADEWLEPPAQRELSDLFTSGRHETADVWLLTRRLHFQGHRMRAGSFAREQVERLFRSHLRHTTALVHEGLDTRGAKVARSAIALEHDTARSAQSYWDKLQSYAQIWSQTEFQRGRRALPVQGWLAASAYLLKNLVLRGGFIDGGAGLRYHLLHARYAWLKYTLLANLSRR